MMNAFCEKCGSPLSPDAAFCVACGNKVSAAPSSPAPQPQYMQPQYMQPQYMPARKPKKTLILVLAAVLVVAAIAVTLILTLGGGPAIDPDKLNGSWEGVIKLEVVNDGAEEVGITRASIGDDQEVQILLELDKDGKGIMAIYPFECEAVLRGSSITASQKNEGRGVTVYFDGGVSESGDTYSMKGTWRFTDDNGKVYASGSWNADMLE